MESLSITKSNQPGIRNVSDPTTPISMNRKEHSMSEGDLFNLLQLIDIFESDCTVSEHAYNSVYLAGMKAAVTRRLNENNGNTEKK